MEQDEKRNKRRQTIEWLQKDLDDYSDPSVILLYKFTERDAQWRRKKLNQLLREELNEKIEQDLCRILAAGCTQYLKELLPHNLFIKPMEIDYNFKWGLI